MYYDVVRAVQQPSNFFHVFISKNSTSVGSTLYCPYLGPIVIPHCIMDDEVHA